MNWSDENRNTALTSTSQKRIYFTDYGSSPTAACYDGGAFYFALGGRPGGTVADVVRYR